MSEGALVAPSEEGGVCQRMLDGHTKLVKSIKGDP
jgi:hypothetical protein